MEMSYLLPRGKIINGSTFIFPELILSSVEDQPNCSISVIWNTTEKSYAKWELKGGIRKSFWGAILSIWLFMVACNISEP